MSARVLIIDPDEDQLTTLRFALQEQGYSVDVARDGLEGFEKFRKLQPSLVITELMIDRLSGFELSSRISSNEEFQAPVIFYTGFYRDERARKEVILKYGAAGYFVKPFQLQALKRAVAIQLGQIEKEEIISSEVPPLRQESRKRFASSVLSELQAKGEPPAAFTEESVAEAHETFTPSKEPPQPSTPEVPALNPSESPSQGRSAEQSDDWLAQLPMFQVASPLPPDVSATQPSETMSAPEQVHPEAPPELEPLPLQPNVAEVPISPLPMLSEPAAPPPFYKSRPVQILAVMVLLGGAFLLFRNPGSTLIRKPDVGLQQDSGRAPDNQVSSSPAGNQTAGLPVAGTESGNPETLPAPIANSPPEVEPAATNQPGDTESTASSENAAGTLPSQSRPSEGSEASSSSGINLMISDVTGEGGPPYLQKSKRPIVSLDMVQAAGNKPLVIRVVISWQGKVIEATPLNQNESNASLSRAALAAIQNWEFSPVRGKGEKRWTRYFSFRFAE